MMKQLVETVRPGEISICNPGSKTLKIWIEPWCDDLELPSRSTLVFRPIPPADVPATAPAMEIDDGRLVIWASCPGTADVFIDGAMMDTGSHVIALDAGMFDMPVKSFVGLVFGDQPGTRPGGRRDDQKRSWLHSLIARLSGRIGEG